jgi:hypothetical protein
MDAGGTYGQEMEPPEHRQRPAQGAVTGAGGAPSAANDADVIEMGSQLPRWSWGSARRPTISVALAALAAGLLLGFVGGHLQASTSRPNRPARALSTALPVGDTSISATGNRCSVQISHTLQLGIEIMNRSDHTVALHQVKPVLPMGGLHATASHWGTCGLLPEPGPEQAMSLGPGATGWLTVTFDVMVNCPRPLPVWFKISYMQASRLETAEIYSFPDLGLVRYNTCNIIPAGQ